MKPGWSAPKPALIPKPTIWPAGLALAVMLLAWGLLVSPVLVAIAMVAFIVPLAGWIGDIRHEKD